MGLQKPCSIQIGFPLASPDAPTQTGPGALNSATTKIAFGFCLNNTQTLSKVRVFCSAIGGVPTALGTKCDLFSDASGVPNVSLEGKTLAAPPTAGAVLEWTGFTTSMTAGTQYWIVISNAAGTPGTNNFTIQFIKNQGSVNTGNAQGYGNSIVYTTDGTNWTSGGSNPQAGFGCRLEFSGPAYEGLLFTNSGAVETTSTAYLTREFGVTFTLPSTFPTLNVRGAAMHIATAGTKPSGGLIYNLRTGAIGSFSAANPTRTIPAANLLGLPNWVIGLFPSDVVLTANSIVNLTAAVAGGATGSAANDWRYYPYTIDNDANSKAQLPFAGIKQLYFDGSSWTNTDTKVLPFSLLLADGSEFTVPAGATASYSRLMGGM